MSGTAAQVLQLQNKGLYTSPNEFSAVPQGALVSADNCVIDVNGIIEPRRGNTNTYTLPNANDRLSQIAVYQNVVVGAWSNASVGYVSGSSFTALSGTYNHIDANLARIRFLLSNNNLYFTSSTGVYKMDSYSATPVLSGIPRGLDVQLALTGGSGFLSDQNQAAYRILWGIQDANKNIIEGAPSGRAVLINSAGGSRNATVTSTIPSGITTSHFYQIYRSKNSGGVAIVPDDELQLIYEANPNGTDISNGYISFTDVTTDDLRGASLYTDPSQQGIAQSNDRPPLSKYFEDFNGNTVYANTTSKHRMFLTVLAVGGSSGIAINDTIMIAGTVYTGKGSETIASGFFNVVTGGTPAQNIADTTNSLIRVINRYATNTLVYAYYLSGQNDLPGQILIEERGIGGSSFVAIASAHGSAFNPVLPTSGSTVISDNDNFQNGIMVAKYGQSEAVPLANVFRVGLANNAIRGVKKLRSSFFIFKEHEGIYRMTGNDPSNYVIELFDSSARIIAPESLAVVNNQIWCLCDQGLTVVTETGVSVASRPIEDLILDQLGLAYNQVQYYSFGVGYESARKYILWTVASSGDTTATQAFVFNVFTQAFTRWPLTRTCGIVNPVDDKLYAADGNSKNILAERKNRNYTDYIDAGVAYVISSFDGVKNVSLTSTSGINVGDLLYQSSTVHSVITAIGASFVTVNDSSLSWVNGAVTVYAAIPVTLQYAAVTGDNPGLLKGFPEIVMLFKLASFISATLSFATDSSVYFESVTINGNPGGLWGLIVWGTDPWGGANNITLIRTIIPLEKQRGALLQVKFQLQQGYGYFKLNGFSLPITQADVYEVAK